MRDLKSALLRRVLTLRQLPLFASITLDELVIIADNLVPVRFAPGDVVADAGQRPGAIHLVVNGAIASRPSGIVWNPGDVLGALEVSAGRVLTHSVVAVDHTETLQLLASDFGELLDENYGLLQAVLRALATRMLRLPPPATPVAPPVSSAASLGFVERLLVLRQQIPFSRARLQALGMLAHASDEVTWPAGSTVIAPGHAANAAFIVIDGATDVKASRGHRTLGPGDSIGLLETLAGVHHTATVRTTATTRVLRSTAPAIVDVLEDHTDVGLGIIGTFAAALLDAAA